MMKIEEVLENGRANLWSIKATSLRPGLICSLPSECFPVYAHEYLNYFTGFHFCSIVASSVLSPNYISS